MEQQVVGGGGVRTREVVGTQLAEVEAVEDAHFAGGGGSGDGGAGHGLMNSALVLAAFGASWFQQYYHYYVAVDEIRN